MQQCVYTDNLGASVAQNVTVNNDMVINPANKLTATNIDAVAINNAIWIKDTNR